MSNDPNQNQINQNQYETTEKYTINPNENNYAYINPNTNFQQTIIQVDEKNIQTNDKILIIPIYQIMKFYK